MNKELKELYDILDGIEDNILKVRDEAEIYDGNEIYELMEDALGKVQEAMSLSDPERYKSERM